MRDYLPVDPTESLTTQDIEQLDCEELLEHLVSRGVFLDNHERWKFLDANINGSVFLRAGDNEELWVKYGMLAGRSDTLATLVRGIKCKAKEDLKSKL